MKFAHKVAATLAVLSTMLIAGQGSAQAPHGSDTIELQGQPRMREARAALVRAREHLQNAEHNKGGHRVNAISIINDAISEVDKGIVAGGNANRASQASAIPLAQPRMEAALVDLNAARNRLENAEHNKGGHRVRAIALVDQAVAQVRLGIEAGKSK